MSSGLAMSGPLRIESAGGSCPAFHGPAILAFIFPDQEHKTSLRRIQRGPGGFVKTVIGIYGAPGNLPRNLWGVARIPRNRVRRSGRAAAADQEIVRLRDVHASTDTPFPIDDLPAAGRTHPCPEATFALTFDLADAMRVMHDGHRFSSTAAAVATFYSQVSQIRQYARFPARRQPDALGLARADRHQCVLLASGGFDRLSPFIPGPTRDLREGQAACRHPRRCTRKRPNWASWRFG